ncbi:MAG: HAD family hydrolase [SAR324 cluster bacterium]|nr:HAD family hydrolase [SAR324 cluster bacterium]
MMTNPSIRAVTFDLWDTVLIDDTDEPKRQAQGLAPKPIARRNLVHAFLSEHSPISKETVDTAYDVADAAFRHVWYEQHVTWEVKDRISVLLKGLGRQLPAEQFDELVRLHEEMEIQISPDLVPGVAEAIRNLHGKYSLVVISDTIFTPGWGLRKILEKENLLQYFDAFIFSDEQGCCKPDRAVFEAAVKAVNVGLTEFVHIGDREEKDIAGPQNVGGRGILCTAALDRGSQSTRADAICSNFKDLESILESL